MKVLMVGNSHAGSIRRALKERRVALPAEVDLKYYVVAGGLGPDLTVVDRKLVVRAFNENHPPYTDHPATLERSVTDYDLIVVSALGYVDGGFAFRSTILWQGLLAEYGPKFNPRVRTLISQACMRDVVRHGLSQQPGFVFLRELFKCYRGPVVVQPV